MEINKNLKGKKFEEHLPYLYLFDVLIFDCEGQFVVLESPHLVFLLGGRVGKNLRIDLIKLNESWPT